MRLGLALCLLYMFVRQAYSQDTGTGGPLYCFQHILSRNYETSVFRNGSFEQNILDPPCKQCCGPKLPFARILTFWICNRIPVIRVVIRISLKQPDTDPDPKII